MAQNRLYVIIVILILAGLVGGIVVALLAYMVLESSLSWPTEKFEYKGLAIISDAQGCANVAHRIFTKGGTIVDAAIAALLCMGVTAPHLSGVGGGFMAVLYNKTADKLIAVDALGVVPAGMQINEFQKNWTLTQLVAGYKLLHERFGKLSWADLFTDAVALADKGFVVGPRLAEAVKRNKKALSYDPNGRSAFINPGTADIVVGGAQLRLPRIGTVLRRIAKEPKTLYSGSLGQELDAELKRIFPGSNNHITLNDLLHYRPRFIDALSAELGDSKVLHTVPFPGSGAIVGAILERHKIPRAILQGKGLAPVPVMSDVSLHLLVENIKFALAFRENLGDNGPAISDQDKLLSKIQKQFDTRVSSQHPLGSYEDYGGTYVQDEDFGGAHLSIRDAEGNAISVTAGLNHEFGCKYWTSSGILMNSYMGSFPDPRGQYGRQPSPNNVLAPGKQPLTSMIPSLITNITGGKRQIHAVFGSSGGTAGISAMAQLFACAAEFPLHSCVTSNVAVRPTLGKDGYLVQVGSPNLKFDPASILLKMGHKVDKKSVFTASATAIVTSARDSWIAPADKKHTDGASAGVHYVHPVIKNDRR
ncbi:glutathione hydrolase 1 proenzyme-like isoform X2 [Dermacentor albipictus]|uniref:glutathione hydrolase 1 proenzyme-like isoform X2 n=1 Tax=Dermacentor albipictus TaxID=60249 RepID=UPI0031FC3310